MSESIKNYDEIILDFIAKFIFNFIVIIGIFSFFALVSVLQTVHCIAEKSYFTFRISRIFIKRKLLKRIRYGK